VHTFNIIFQAVAALLGVGVLGFLIVNRRLVPENIMGVLATMAIDIALPCLVFANIIVDFSPSKFPDWWQLPLWWLFFQFVALLLSLITMFISQKSTRSEFAVTTFFQNGIFFPIIILSGIFGPGNPYLAQLFLFIFLHPSLYFSTYYLFFRKHQHSEKQSHIRLTRILNPVLIMTAIALALKLPMADKYLPEFLVSIVKMVGAMSLPLLMIFLGGSLYLDFKKKGKIYTIEIVKFLLVKNVIFPLAYLGILLLIRPDYNIALIIMLQGAIPPVTGIPIQVEREGGNRAITNQFVLASFIFSVISIPAMFILFDRFFPMP
jgi:malate permease and related proteins